MTNLPNHIIGLAIALAIAGCSTLDNPFGTRTAAPRDHYDPAFLNEAAVAAWSRGDRSTALLLLERAAVIAPQDRRILNNLEMVKRTGSRDVLTHYGPIMDAQRETATPSAATVTTTSVGPAPAATRATPAASTAAATEAEARFGLWPR